MILRDYVTPLAGVWVEISKLHKSPRHVQVTPLAGVWVEIGHIRKCKSLHPVTPLAGVWVEIIYSCQVLQPGGGVTPLAGVWVEMAQREDSTIPPNRHSPCGSVG